MLVSCNNIGRSFGALTVLDGVTFRLAWRQKLGLVGRNGCGKTTLMRILAGTMEPDTGTVAYARGVRFGYLRQEQQVSTGRTVFEEAQAAFAPILAMEQRLRNLEHDMAAHAESSRLDEVMEEYSLLHDRFEAMGGFSTLRDIQVVLRRLGFGEKDMGKTNDQLSGGEKTRLALARLLLSAPDVLLLDEPTNHLDLEATEWLEQFLRDFGGAVLLVSHDRTFLDAVVSDVAEIQSGKMQQYHGNFTAYWHQRAERQQRQEEVYQRQQAEIARLEEFWRRNKAGQNRNMAWSRLRAADRIREEAVERPRDAKGLTLKISERQRSGNEVVIVDRLGVQYGERTLFDSLSLLVYRGQRIGIVGPNGSGKSTLLKAIMGRQQPTSGQARFGASVSVGYFAQETSDLDPTQSVLDTIMADADLTPEQARTYLAAFLFTGDDVFQRVERLSGGEKNRLVLAQLVLAQPNLLVLDEPTNHLDIDAREALTGMLKHYGGTLLLASHDRYLLDEVTTHTLVVSEGGARLYDLPYTAHKELLARNALREATAAAPPSPVVAPSDTGANPATMGMNSFQLSKARRKAATDVTKAEARVAEAEDWIARLEEVMAAPTPGDDMVKLAHDYETAQREMEEAMAQWEETAAYAEAIGVQK